MKKLTFSFLGLFLLCITVQAQDKGQKKTKDKQPVIINNEAVQDVIQSKKTLKVNTQKKVALFDNVQTIDNDDTNLMIKKNLAKDIQLSNSKAVDLVTLPEVNIQPASVNGSLTPRNNYLNRIAYLEFINVGVLDPENNTAQCNCGGTSGLTYVNVLFRGEADQRYMVTMDVSPFDDSETPGISLFVENSGQVYNFTISQPNDEIDVIIRPDETGMIKLWSQCARPNDNPMNWVFNEATIQKID
ncbi:hypothetical protein [Fodinibius salsisoli]|uniref:Uncharacterized protein n=1 Tax=Fodinibius salsisoli TaxID=2820877 RepID=A0ABT3PQR6_9BACT|nr:hypothetical protein [Fodinibius salsisoli]MCW9708217.1 hypothetical protein [Fodinibius salsisoli]